MKINNKDVIQSYIVTTAKYDYSIYQKRILYRLIEAFQSLIKGQKLEGRLRAEKDLFGDYHITMPIAAFLADEKDKNYEEVKKALKGLESKQFEYEDEREWELIRLIQNPKILKYANDVTFRINPKIFDALLNFSKGYRKYELKTAMSFESIYSMRFYELLSGQKRPISYTVDALKIMFNLENKYKLTADFIRSTVDVAKKELNLKSPYSFEYKANKRGRKIHSITFYPVYNPENRDSSLEKKSLQKRVSLNWDLDRIIVNYLSENFGFTDNEIKNNIDLFKLAEQELDLMIELSSLKLKAQEARTSPQAFIVGILKKKLKL
jgi:hypothetical protein